MKGRKTPKKEKKCFLFFVKLSFEAIRKTIFKKCSFFEKRKKYHHIYVTTGDTRKS